MPKKVQGEGDFTESQAHGSVGKPPTKGHHKITNRPNTTMAAQVENIAQLLRDAYKTIPSTTLNGRVEVK